MAERPDEDKFYDKLKTQLYDTALWPSEYLFKFIIKTKPEEILKVQKLFDNMGAVITTKASKNGKYTSVSINVKMKNPDAVISKYKIVAQKIEGVISL